MTDLEVFIFIGKVELQRGETGVLHLLVHLPNDATARAEPVEASRLFLVSHVEQGGWTGSEAPGTGAAAHVGCQRFRVEG